MVRQWFKQFKPALWGDVLGSTLHARRVLREEAVDEDPQQQVSRAWIGCRSCRWCVGQQVSLAFLPNSIFDISTAERFDWWDAIM